MLDQEFRCTPGPWLSHSDYYVGHFWRRQNICPAVIFLRQMVTLLLFSLSTDFLNHKRSHRWGIGEHIFLHFCCAYKWVHTEWSHFMSSVATFQYSAGTESCSAEGHMGFLLPQLLPLLKVLSLWMSCMVTHLINHIDLHFTSQEHT